MIDFGVKQKDLQVQMIADYLATRCKKDPFLKEACTKPDKTMEGVMKYVVEEAHKLAQNHCAFVDDETVYGWAVHYILEGSLHLEEPEVKPEPKPEPVVKKVKQDDVQLFLF